MSQTQKPIQLAVRLLSRNWFRILFAAVLSYLVLVLFSVFKTVRIEGWGFCQPQIGWLGCILSTWSDAFTLENLDSFSILLVAMLYLLEGGDRKRQSHYEAWQILDSAFSADVETSYARLKALQDLNQDNVSLKGVDVPGADLEGINLYKADLRRADFKGCKLKGANLSRARLNGADFSPQIKRVGDEEIERRTNLTEANLLGADLTGANLLGANLTGAILEHACLRNVQINQFTIMPDPKWQLVWQASNRYYEPSGYRQSNFRKADFSNAYLVGVDLSRTNLVQTDFTGANLAAAKLEKANLTGANLRGTNLAQANLSGANLTGADLTGANLTDVITSRDTNLTKAKFDRTAIQGNYLTGSKSLAGATVLRSSQHALNRKSVPLKHDRLFQWFQTLIDPTKAEAELIEPDRAIRRVGKRSNRSGIRRARRK